MLNFFDFEVFEYDWLVVILNPFEKSETIIVNDAEKLASYYESHSKEIWVGYNCKNYDQFILKGILAGFDPKKVNDHIIKKKKTGYSFSDLFTKIPLLVYDCMEVNDGGLKSLEGYMGNDIKETSVPFDISRKLTPEEIQETVKYCRHDVEQTLQVWLYRKKSFDARMSLLKAFSLPLTDISRTDTQLSAKILGAIRNDYADEFNISFPDTLRLKKYKYVLDWFKNPENHCYQKQVGRRTTPTRLEIEIAGVPHIFAWGGLHGAIPKYSGTGYFLMIDVTALYPSLIIIYNLLSRNCNNPKRYENIYKTNIEMKKTDDPLRPAYKLVCNKTYGGMKDVNNSLYDPRQANNVCIYGQLLILDLIEKIEPFCKLIQTNTDGLLIKMPGADTEENRKRFFKTISGLVSEWENRTGLKMEFEEYEKIYQKDVNNYIAISSSGKVKRKGAYVKKLSPIDNDLPIINDALNAYMVEGIPIEETIIKCDDLIKFQKIVKVSSKYESAYHNGKRLTEKCFRVFASSSWNDGYIGKRKPGGNIEKFANTPERCFIENGDINEVKTDKRLNKQWYIDLTKKRLEQFGGADRGFI